MVWCGGGSSISANGSSRRRLIGERARVTVGNETLRIYHGGREVAAHAELEGRHGRVVDDAHLAGLVGAKERPTGLVLSARAAPPPALLRPLAEYEAAAGAGF
jgi:hypothetical protein